MVCDLGHMIQYGSMYPDHVQAECSLVTQGGTQTMRQPRQLLRGEIVVKA